VKSKLTIERLRTVLSYDPETGIFTWRVSLRRDDAGSRAGSETKAHSKRRIQIDGQTYCEHRLAWFYVHGTWPRLKIVHRDFNWRNNAISNLVPATGSQVSARKRLSERNGSGFKGVSYEPGRRKWRADIRVNGRLYNLGRFSDKELAVRAYREASKRHFGNFARPR
jgi:hypothetical protein